MQDGERTTIRGSSGTPYVLARKGAVYSCSCPAWEKQRLPPAQRTCKHLRAYLGEDHEDARVGQSRVAVAQTRARKSALAAGRDPAATRAHRTAALADALARFPAAAARMRAVYDMPLPRHLAHAIGFWLGLTDEEREEAWAYLGCGPAGVGEWLEPGGLDREPALDERLQGRYRRDPPEFVTVFSGNSDGSHWGLWYDDPRELPRVIAHNWARDDAETGARKPTLLATLRENLTRESFDPDEWPHHRRVLAWLDECAVGELTAHREEPIGPPLPRTQFCTGGMDPVVAGARVPDGFLGVFHPANSPRLRLEDLARQVGEAHVAAHLAAHASDLLQQERLEIYRNDPAKALPWISQARDELAAGEPLRALFLARELHWFDGDSLRAEALDLGVRGYEAVGRHALAEVLRVHCAHRDLPYVHIYKAPPTPPLVEAVAMRDEPRIAELLAAPLDPAHLAQAIDHTTDLALLDRLLAHAGAGAPADRLVHAVEQLASYRKYDLDSPEQRAVIDHLLARGADVAPAFTRALAHKLPELALRLADHLDLARADHPLHRAIETAAVDVVARLLARGADPTARDAAGKTPHDRAREIWQDHRAESHAILALLPALPAPAAPPSGELAVGDAVQHAKFGAGKVLARDGAGPTAKLTIAFPGEVRTLLARFVTRA